MAPNSWRFEGFLLGFDSDYCGVYIFAADNHLLGMRPACKQLYFLGHPPKPQLVVLCYMDSYPHVFLLVVH
jgi:hypothetical protein